MFTRPVASLMRACPFVLAPSGPWFASGFYDANMLASMRE
jgi:hypothetical protein